MKAYSFIRRGPGLILIALTALPATGCDAVRERISGLGIGGFAQNRQAPRDLPPLAPIVRDVAERFGRASELRRRGPSYEEAGRSILKRHKPALLLVRNPAGVILFRHHPADLKPSGYRKLITALLASAGKTRSGQFTDAGLVVRHEHVSIGGKDCLVAVGYPGAAGMGTPTKYLNQRNLQLAGSLLVLVLGAVLLLVFVILRFSSRRKEERERDEWHGEAAGDEESMAVPRPPEPAVRLEALAGIARDARREQSPEAEKATEQAEENSARGDSIPLEFEQERWNLPGYLSLSDVVPTPPGVGDLDFTGGGAGSLFVGKSLFDRAHYRLDQGGWNDAMGDLESLAREFMTDLGDRFSPSRVLLYLRNRRNRLYPLLMSQGNVFVSGTFIDRENPPADVIEKIQEGQCVVAEDGRSLHLPVPCRAGLLGVVHVTGENSLYNRENLAAMWALTRKFGEQLYQAKIFEQAAMDGESTLNAGMSFHRDLRHEYSLQSEIAGKRGLLLIQFQGAGDPVHMRTLGLALRALFSDRERLYRVALDVFAVLGPAMDDETLERRVVDYLNYVRNHQNVSVSAGYALLEGETLSPSDWFQSAARALEEAAAAGKNFYRVHRRPDKAVMGASVR